MNDDSCAFATLPNVATPHTQKSLFWSLYYMVRDFAALAGLYYVYPKVQAEYGLPGLLVWWNLAGE